MFPWSFSCESFFCACVVSGRPFLGWVVWFAYSKLRASLFWLLISRDGNKIDCDVNPGAWRRLSDWLSVIRPLFRSKLRLSFLETAFERVDFERSPANLSDCSWASFEESLCVPMTWFFPSTREDSDWPIVFTHCEFLLSFGSREFHVCLKGSLGMWSFA